MSNENAITLALPPTAELMRQATDCAGVCKEIVSKTALEIQGRKYVRVEGWMSIATAHGCVASARDVERVHGGFRAIGELRRISDGAVLSTAEGFVGEDEPTWFGGQVETRNGQKTLPKRPDYAIRAMTQTRAISRACRTAFAHVVVLMDSGLSTTPAEEVPDGGFDDHAQPPQRAAQAPEPRRVSPTQEPAAVSVPRDPVPAGDDSWREVIVPPFIKKYAGSTLGEMADKDLQWWANNYEPRPYKGRISDKDLDFKAALMEGLKTLTPGGSPAQSRPQPTEEQLANVVEGDPADVEF